MTCVFTIYVSNSQFSFPKLTCPWGLSSGNKLCLPPAPNQIPASVFLEKELNNPPKLIQYFCAGWLGMAEYWSGGCWTCRTSSYSPGSILGLLLFIIFMNSIKYPPISPGWKLMLYVHYMAPNIKSPEDV